MAQKVKTDQVGKGELLREGVHTTEKSLTEEIEYILRRNQDEKFLRSLLTRALILEKLTK